MNTYAGKEQGNKVQSTKNEDSGRQINGKSSFEYEVNRPASIEQRTLQAMADNSLQVKQLRSVQEMIHNSPQEKQAAQLQLVANDYVNGQQQPIRQKENKSGFADEGISIDLGMVASRAQSETLAPEKPIEDKGGTIQRVVRIGEKKLKSRKNISQLWRAAEIDEQLGLGSEEKKQFQGELLLLAEGKNITDFTDWDEAYERLRNPKILIKGDDGVVSIIKNTTDLMIWLGSYPMSSQNQPDHYVDTKILQRALRLLEGVKKTVTNGKVWRAVAAAEKMKSSDDDTKWDDLDLVASVDLLGSTDEENPVPRRYKRKLPSDEYKKKIQELRSSLKGYKLVGLHATTMENTGPLVSEGVSKARFNTGNGVGKGNGFYIIPVINITDKIINNTRAWGSHVVSVFLPESAEEKWAGSGDNVQTLEEKNSEQKPLYYMFGKLEAVIPPSLCPKVKIVVDPADISMGDTRYEAEPYDDEFGFMKSL